MMGQAAEYKSLMGRDSARRQSGLCIQILRKPSSNKSDAFLAVPHEV